MTATLLALLLCFAVGFPAARLLLPHTPFRLTSALAFLLGTGIVPGVLLVLSLAGVRWSRASLLAACAVVFAALVALVIRRSPAAKEGGGRISLRPAGLAIDALTLVTVVGFGIFAAASEPIENDFLAIWGLKAKIFWFHGGIDWGWLTAPGNDFSHPDYPILLPLLHDVVAVIGGQWNDRWLGLFHPAFAGALLLVVRSLLTSEMNSDRASALSTFALASLAMPPWIGMAEGPLVAWAAAGLLLLRRALAQREFHHYFPAAAVLLGLAAFTKNEGISFLVAVAIALLVARRSVRPLLHLWPAVIIVAPWMILRAVHGLATDLARGPFIERAVSHLARIDTLLEALQAHSAGFTLFWLGLLVAFALRLRTAIEREKLVIVSVVVQMIFFLGAYLVTPQDIRWHVQWSWERLLHQVMLPLGFVAVVLLHDEFRRWSADRAPSAEAREPA